MQDKQDVLERFCAALAALLEVGFEDLTPGAISEIETIGGQDYRSTGESS